MRTPGHDANPEPTAASVLARVEGARRARRESEIADLLAILDWADLHSGDPQAEPGAVPASKGGERLVVLGGEGTPGVAEFALAELAIARMCHVLAARSAMADALDLRHRLAQLWQAARAGSCETWVARKVASLTRRLTKEQAALVDAAVADAVGHGPARMLAVAEAKVIEADLDAQRAREAEARRRRGVWLTKTRPGDALDPETAGLRTIVARVDASDAIWFDATIQRLADDLADRPEHEDRTPDELRAEAFGLIARGQAIEPAARPATTVYVHLHQASLEGDAAVARVEAHGPMLLGSLARLLGHTNIKLTPVIDLNQGAATDAYELPTSVTQRVRLRTGGDVFPHASRSTTPSTTRLDQDHAAPYDPGGPPGQTGDHNQAPLSRYHHRAKTHGGYQVRQLGPNRYLWTTPHGLTRYVDHFGTHEITLPEGRLMQWATAAAPA